MRLIVAIISTTLEEAALAVIVLLGLPQFGIEVPLAGLIAAMVLWLAIAVTLYQIGSRALRKKPLISLPDMIGGRGKVVSRFDPEGMVRIRGRPGWQHLPDGEVEVGDKVVVVAQEGLKLVVRKSGSGNPEPAGMIYVDAAEKSGSGTIVRFATAWVREISILGFPWLVDEGDYE